MEYWTSEIGSTIKMPDLTDNSFPELWELYQKAVADNLPPHDADPFPVELDQDLPRWIAFNMHLRMVALLPYDHVFPLQESIKALECHWKSLDVELLDWAKKMPGEAWKTVENRLSESLGSSRQCKSWHSVSVWRSGIYYLHVPIRGFSSAGEACQFGENIKKLSMSTDFNFVVWANTEESCKAEAIEVYTMHKSKRILSNLSVMDIYRSKDLDPNPELVRAYWIYA